MHRQKCYRLMVQLRPSVLQQRLPSLWTLSYATPLHLSYSASSELHLQWLGFRKRCCLKLIRLVLRIWHVGRGLLRTSKRVMKKLTWEAADGEECVRGRPGTELAKDEQEKAALQDQMLMKEESTSEPAAEEDLWKEACPDEPELQKTIARMMTTGAFQSQLAERQEALMAKIAQPAAAQKASRAARLPPLSMCTI
eukprot:TRINITY_DN21610_c0_g1_i1.p1 TRINITY_DN21610_c0_g1~~TRINITY_DN21610_c0_g1_i1.p1  ORF type:complete len:196 (+),score=42.52 TRINITY_DN21610_c0_g1_i1:163-750(+)